MRLNATTLLIAVTLFAALLGPSTAGAQGGALAILKPIGFAENSFATEAVREECRLQEKVPDFIAEYAKDDFGKITFLDGASGGDAPGKVLFVEITNVSGSGNMWVGNRSKSLSIRGELRQDGKVIGSFRSRRETGGGAFGGYKGVCAFLGRCAKALGKDVAQWLKNPTMNATISSQ